jgi:hypothetical protein
MNKAQLIDKFLEEINSSCFPVNGGGNKKIREQAFLKKRFDPKNYEPKLIQHTELARQINEELNEKCESAIGTTCQNVVRALVEQYRSEMTTDGVDVDCLVKGSKGQKGAWEIGYRWLHDLKFPRWLTQEKNRVWQAWKTEAKPDVAKVCFNEVSDSCRGMTGKSRHKEQIYLDRDYSMTIELDQYSDYYLLLLNQGQTYQGKETKYLVCPSPAFAPHLQPVKVRFTLPQSGSQFDVINFDEPGREEYLGILVKERPNLPDWMIEAEEDVLQTWDELRIYQLWQEINKQRDYQIFYQSFEVIDN